MNKLYIVVRSDLMPGAQIAHSVHAARSFIAEYPELDRQWYEAGGNLAVLGIHGETELQALLERSRKSGLRAAAFHETDFGGQLTAISLEAAAHRLVSSLPLALKPPRAA